MGLGFRHLLVFNELWIHIAGWEFVTPHKFYCLRFPVRFSCSCFAPQATQVLAGYREGKVLLLSEGRESLFGGSALAERDEDEDEDLLYIHE